MDGGWGCEVDVDKFVQRGTERFAQLPINSLLNFLECWERGIYLDK